MNTQIEKIISELKEQIKLKEEKASKLVLEKEAEEKLYELISFQEWLNQEIENLKQEIVKKAESIRKNFNGFVGEKLLFRFYRPKVFYKISNISLLKKEFILEVVQKRANSQTIKEYKEKTGKLPEGVVEEVVPAKLEVKIKAEKYEENEAEPHTA